MDFNQLHFASPLWLWAWFALPIALTFLVWRHLQEKKVSLESFVDSHLLPYLLVKDDQSKKKWSKTFFIWSVLWTCLILALAGPRWHYRDVELFSKDQSLVIALDLSESMNALDIKPSRLVRAKQKIEDLIHLSEGVKIGLLAFAADAHMITPITDDKETIRHLLPAVSTDLVYIQGSRLASALDMASSMLKVEMGSNKAILIISDGGFEDKSSAFAKAKKLADEGVRVHVMGVGTIEGAPVSARGKKNASIPLSKLETEQLEMLSQAGNGRYIKMSYSNEQEKKLISDLEEHANAQVEMGKKSRFWDEGFYWMIFPVLPILLWWFRKGGVCFIFLFLLPFLDLSASSFSDRIKNSEQMGEMAFETEEYEKAAQLFQDPYRKGVAYYKAEDFAKAEEMFRASSRKEVAKEAAYNLGNSLAKQQKFEEAAAAYEQVLKQWPDCIKAKENLQLINEMLEKQKTQNSPPTSQPQKGDGKQKTSEDKPSSDESKQDEENNKEVGDNDSHDKRPPQPQPQQIIPPPQHEHLPPNKCEGEDDPSCQEDKQLSEKTQDISLPSQEEQDADLWLNQIENDPKEFLKRKFYIESKKNGTTRGTDPW